MLRHYYEVNFQVSGSTNCCKPCYFRVHNIFANFANRIKLNTRENHQKPGKY